MNNFAVASAADYLLPPSDEGGGFCEAKDGGREKLKQNIKPTVSLPQFRLRSTAPSSEGAKYCIKPVYW